MQEIEEIKFNNKIMALIIRNNIKVENSRFLTPENYPFQLGIHSRKAGAEFKAHIHNPVERKINTTQEFLYIIEGKVKADFYDNDKNIISSTVLNKGDMVLHVEGGHGFQVLEDAKIVEIKQGPYSGVEQDKKKF